VSTYDAIIVGGGPAGRTCARTPARGGLAKRAVARGFAWMFSGASLPAPRLFDLVFGKAR